MGSESITLQLIHQRYEDTSLVIFRQQQKKSKSLKSHQNPGFVELRPNEGTGKAVKGHDPVGAEGGGELVLNGNANAERTGKISSSMCVIL